MGTLDETNQLPKMVSKTITIALPKGNPGIKTDIDAELNNGWQLVSSWYDSSRDEVRYTFVRPKRRA